MNEECRELEVQFRDLRVGDVLPFKDNFVHFDRKMPNMTVTSVETDRVALQVDSFDLPERTYYLRPDSVSTWYHVRRKCTTEEAEQTQIRRSLHVEQVGDGKVEIQNIPMFTTKSWEDRHTIRPAASTVPEAEKSPSEMDVKYVAKALEGPTFEEKACGVSRDQLDVEFEDVRVGDMLLCPGPGNGSTVVARSMEYLILRYASGVRLSENEDGDVENEWVVWNVPRRGALTVLRYSVVCSDEGQSDSSQLTELQGALWAANNVAEKLRKNFKVTADQVSTLLEENAAAETKIRKLEDRLRGVEYEAYRQNRRYGVPEVVMHLGKPRD